MTKATVVAQTPYPLSVSDGSELRQTVPTEVDLDERIQRYIDIGAVVVVPTAPIAPIAPIAPDVTASDTTKPRAVAARQDSQENPT